MKNSRIPPDTTCPFCKTELKLGATACSGCGALWTVQVPPILGLTAIFGFFLFLLGVWYLLGTHDPHGLIPTAVGGGLVYLIIKSIRYEWIKS